MFCKKCGAEIKEGIAFCPGCGTKVEAPKPVEAPASQPIYYAAPPKKTKSAGAAKGLGITSMICAILAALGEFFGFILPIPVPILPLTIAAIVTGAVSKTKGKDKNQERSGFAVAGMALGISTASIYMIEWVVSTIVSTILSIVSLIISAILSVIIIVLYVALIAASIGFEMYL